MIDRLFRIAPFTVRLRSPLAAVGRHIERFYAGPAHEPQDAFVDFDIQILPGAGSRAWWRQQARFALDGAEPFYPVPRDQAAALFEWGLNWCVAQRDLGYLVMHAAVVADGDRALMLPGSPGAGKSTLCASMVFSEQWRLLSDELAILDPASGALVAHPRPVNLKNESIDIVAGFAGTTLGPAVRDTRKGTVAHAACPETSTLSADQPATVRWVVFPRFEAGGEPHFEEITRAEAFALISEQSFNRERMGRVGFDALCELLAGARCYEATYGSTADGIALMRRICGS